MCIVQAMYEASSVKTALSNNTVCNSFNLPRGDLGPITLSEKQHVLYITVKGRHVSMLWPIMIWAVYMQSEYISQLLK